MLLRPDRDHWAIENRLHPCKEATVRVDASLVHVGQGSRVLSVLRDLALNLLRFAGITHVAATLRARSRPPGQAVSLVAQPLTQA